MSELVSIILRAKDEITVAAGRSEGALKRLQASAMSLAAPFALTAGAVVAVGTAMVGIATKAANLGDELNDMSIRTGISVENLSALNLAAKTSDTDLQSVANSTRFLNLAMVEAQRGAEEQIAAFKAIGIELHDIKRVSNDPVAALELVAKGLLSVENQANRDAISFRLLGRSAREQVIFLEELAGGFDKIKQEAEDLGIIISSDFAKQAAEFNDNLDKMWLVLDALTMKLGGPLIGLLLDLANAFGLVAVSAKQASLNAIGSQIVGLRKEIEQLEQSAGKSGTSVIDKVMQGVFGGPGPEGVKGKLAESQQALAALLKTEEQLMNPPKAEGPKRTGELPQKGKEKKDKTKEAVDNLVESLKKENDQIQQQIILLQEGEAAAEKYGMAAKFAMLPKGEITAEQTAALNALMNKYAELTQSLRDVQHEKEVTDAIFAEMEQETLGNEEQFLADLDESIAETARHRDGLRELASVSREMSDVYLTDRQKEMLMAERWGEEIKRQIEEIIEKFGDEFPEMGLKAQAMLDNLPQAVEAKEFEQMAQNIRNIYDGITDGISQSIAGIIQGTQTADEAFTKLGQSILLSLGDRLLKATLDPLLDMLTQITTMAARGIGQQIGLAVTASLFAAAKGGMLPGNFVPVRAFAQGGRVTRPTFGFVGEAGPEAVVPLSGGQIPVALNWPELDAMVKAMERAGSPPPLVGYAPMSEFAARQPEIGRSPIGEGYDQGGMVARRSGGGQGGQTPIEMTVVLNNPIDPASMRMRPEEVVSIVAKDYRDDGLTRRVMTKRG